MISNYRGALLPLSTGIPTKSMDIIQYISWNTNQCHDKNYFSHTRNMALQHLQLLKPPAVFRHLLQMTQGNFGSDSWLAHAQNAEVLIVASSGPEAQADLRILETMICGIHPIFGPQNPSAGSLCSWELWTELLTRSQKPANEDSLNSTFRMVARVGHTHGRSAPQEHPNEHLGV